MAARQGQIPGEGSRKQRSKVWEHYDRIRTADGKDKAKCRYCSKELAAGTTIHGTSTLWTHLKKKHGIERPRQPREAASEPSSLKPGYKEACEDLARMIALRGYDSSIVEDDCFRSFVRRLDPAFEVPSRRTIEDMCDRLFDEAEEDLSSKLDCAPGRVNIATRTAKTIEGEVLCTACHFIDDEWNLREMIYDADMVVHHGDWRGPLLGIRQRQKDYEIAECLDDLFIEDNLFSIAWGIVSDHLQQDTSLEDRFSDRYPVKRQLIYTTYMDNVLHSIAQGLFGIISDGYDDYLYPFCDILSLELTRQQREEHLLKLSLPDLWTYNERWYACYCSLEVARIVGEPESALDRLLRKLWGTIYRAIQTISATNRPTSNLCLIELFKVREALESLLERDSIDEAKFDHGFGVFMDREGVPDVLSEAKETVERNIRESYLVWSIPLALDPRYKLSYRVEDKFKSAFPSEAHIYISKIRNKLEDIFTDYSQGDNETSDGDSSGGDEMADDSTDPLQQASPGHRPLQESKKELDRYLEDSLLDENEPEQQYDEIILAKRMEELELVLKSELDRYLEEDRVPQTDDFDILNWWKDNSSKYPTVARVARDALAMPTCNKLSSELMSHIKSRVRGYSKHFYYDFRFW